jgi:hypothetical protein
MRMDYETNPQSSTAEAEKILRALMLADSVVLSRRTARNEQQQQQQTTGRVLSDVTRAKLREAGRRRHLIHKPKSKPRTTVSPEVSKPRRTSHG